MSSKRVSYEGLYCKYFGEKWQFHNWTWQYFAIISGGSHSSLRHDTEETGRLISDVEFSHDSVATEEMYQFARVLPSSCSYGSVRRQLWPMSRLPMWVCIKCPPDLLDEAKHRLSGMWRSYSSGQNQEHNLMLWCETKNEKKSHTGTSVERKWMKVAYGT